MNDIYKKCKTVTIKKRKATILSSHQLFEKALDLIPEKEGRNKEDSDLENHL